MSLSGAAPLGGVGGGVELSSMPLAAFKISSIDIGPLVGKVIPRSGPASSSLPITGNLNVIGCAVTPSTFDPRLCISDNGPFSANEGLLVNEARARSLSVNEGLRVNEGRAGVVDGFLVKEGRPGVNEGFLVKEGRAGVNDGFLVNEGCAGPTSGSTSSPSALGSGSGGISNRTTSAQLRTTAKISGFRFAATSMSSAALLSRFSHFVLGAGGRRGPLSPFFWSRGGGVGISGGASTGFCGWVLSTSGATTASPVGSPVSSLAADSFADGGFGGQVMAENSVPNELSIIDSSVS